MGFQMALRTVLYRTERFLENNSSTILTVMGAVGVVSTTILATKATTKAVRLVDAATEEKGEELTPVEVVEVAAPLYISTAAVGVASLACIFGANALNKKQQASLISAYTMLD
jgi:short-subunit dehydrogenase involved in D-alanine esterification of teichoic acids